MEIEYFVIFRLLKEQQSTHPINCQYLQCEVVQRHSQINSRQSRCGKTGHNALACHENKKMSDVHSVEQIQSIICIVFRL
jgi:hypothetical protein